MAGSRDESVGRSTAAVLADTPEGRSALRHRRLLYRTTSLVLAAVLGGAVLGGLGGIATYGVDTTRVRGEGGGYELEVRYATVTRSALATPFEVVVRRAGGFEGPIDIAVSRSYLAMWDENGFYPSPASETTMGDWLIWQFDPPRGDTFSLAYDARIEPGAQWGRAGEVAVLDEDGAVVVGVTLRTRVLP